MTELNKIENITHIISDIDEILLPRTNEVHYGQNISGVLLFSVSRGNFHFQ